MQIALGDPVLSQDGQNLGKIKHLLLDPDTEQVKKIVVEKGFFLPDDIEVPLEAFQTVEAKAVHLTLSAEQARSLPRFDEDLYAPLPPERIPHFPGYPLGGILWPTEYMGASSVVGGYPLMAGGFPLAASAIEETEENVTPSLTPEVAAYRHHEDETNAVISEGAMVLSRDGKEVGVVHSVTVDTATGKPTVLVIRKGFLFVEDTTLPADTIASVDDGRVTLRLDHNQLPA